MIKRQRFSSNRGGRCLFCLADDPTLAITGKLSTIWSTSASQLPRTQHSFGFRPFSSGMTSLGA